MAIQVLQRQEENNPWKGVGDSISDSIQKAAQMRGDLEYKKGLIDIQRQELGIKSKQAQSETEKFKWEKQKVDMESVSGLLGMMIQRIDPKNPASADAAMKLGAAYAMSSGNEALKSVMANPDLKGILSSVGQLPEDQEKMASARMKGATADLYGQISSGNMPGGGSGTPGQKGLGWDVSQVGPTGPTLTNMDAVQREANARAIGSEAGKPFAETEAGVISKSELIPPVIDEMIAIINKGKGPLNNVYGPGPFGANRISAFGESGLTASIMQALTGGKGRELGLALQKIKVLAFGEGGKNLTDNEKRIVFAAMNPIGKTEDQWVKDLEFVKSMLTRKAELMTRPRSQRGAPSSKSVMGGKYQIEELPQE